MDRADLEIDEGWAGALRAGRVLYIAEPKAFHAPICSALERRAFEVTIRCSLADAFDTVREQAPSCVVCDADQRDGLGIEIARALRAHAVLGNVPLACVSADGDARVEALRFADIVLCADAHPDAAAAQIEALVRAAARLAHGAGFQLAPPHALAGDAALVPLSTLLTALGYERRSGVLEVVSGDSTAHLEVVDGRGISGAISGNRVSALAAVAASLGWPDARFAWTALPLQGDPTDALELRTLCAEALRVLDERSRGAPEAFTAPPLAATG